MVPTEILLMMVHMLGREYYGKMRLVCKGFNDLVESLPGFCQMDAKHLLTKGIEPLNFYMRVKNLDTQDLCKALANESNVLSEYFSQCVNTEIAKIIVNNFNLDANCRSRMIDNALKTGNYSYFKYLMKEFKPDVNLRMLVLAAKGRSFLIMRRIGKKNKNLDKLAAVLSYVCLEFTDAVPVMMRYFVYDEYVISKVLRLVVINNKTGAWYHITDKYPVLERNLLINLATEGTSIYHNLIFDC